MTERVGSLAYRCLMCETADGLVRLERSDAIVRWACAPHVEVVVEDFRRWPGDPIHRVPVGTGS